RVGGVERQSAALEQAAFVLAGFGPGAGRRVRIVLEEHPHAGSPASRQRGGERAALDDIASQVEFAEQARIALERAVRFDIGNRQPDELAFVGRASLSAHEVFLQSLRPGFGRMWPMVRISRPSPHQAHRLAAAEPISISSPEPSAPAMPSSVAILRPAVPPKTRPQATPTAKRIAASRRSLGNT